MSASEPLHVTIPPDYAAALRDAVAAGEYASLDEALADALSAWSRREDEHEEELAWIKAKVRASIADPRPSLSLAEVRAHMDAVFARARSDGDEAA